MKFSRVLSLAMAAAAALSFTACDSTSSDATPEGFKFDSYVDLGAQNAKNPSFASLRAATNGVLNTYTGTNNTAADYVGKHLPDFDVAFFANAEADSAPYFCSPYEYKSEHGKLTTLDQTKLNKTTFLWIGNSVTGNGEFPAYTKVTSEDVNDLKDNTGWNYEVALAVGDNFLAKTADGTYSLIHIETSNGSKGLMVINVKVKAQS